MDPSSRRRTSVDGNLRASLAAAGGRRGSGTTDAASSDSRPMFNKKMRKPSMRFGRAGASVLQDGSAS
ncbi:unnamed protein product, partial [Ectocarpus sp. 12 AP-2014]